METIGKIPQHLPAKLTIVHALWLWLSQHQEGDTYWDWDKYFDECVERGFNTVRIDALLMWLYDVNTNEIREEIEVSGICRDNMAKNTPGYETKGGFVVKRPLEKFIEYMKKAKEHHMYVALTNWCFHDGHSTDHIADANVVSEIKAVPKEERLMNLAQKYVLLIEELRKNHLDDIVAYIEIHNELTGIAHEFGGRPKATQLTEEALSFLQNKYPEYIFCGDYDVDIPADSTFDYKFMNLFAKNIAKNSKAIDHHLYCFGIWTQFMIRTGVMQDPAPYGGLDGLHKHLKETNAFYNRVVKKDAISYSEFEKFLIKPVSPAWIIYFDEILDGDEFDYWYFRNFHKYEDKMKAFWKNNFQFFSQLAQSKNVPVICDEGLIFLMPTQQNFETSVVGRKMLEYAVEHMVENGYWGIMISLSAIPGQKMWENYAPWLKKVNDFIKNGTKESEKAHHTQVHIRKGTDE